jgi:hypothetical protein
MQASSIMFSGKSLFGTLLPRLQRMFADILKFAFSVLKLVIAMQNTAGVFWKMIWQQNISVIAMLTTLIEGSM